MKRLASLAPIAVITLLSLALPAQANGGNPNDLRSPYTPVCIVDSCCPRSSDGEPQVVNRPFTTECFDLVTPAMRRQSKEGAIQ